MSGLCRRIPVLLALAAFLAAQEGLQAHRVGHAGEDAARAAAEACPHGKAAAHLCDAGRPHDHAPDCDLCANAAGRDVEPVSLVLLHVAPAPVADAIVVFSPSRPAPEAVPPAPRGPPSV